MKQITQKELEAVVKKINRLLGVPMEPYTQFGDRCRANVGNYSVGVANGGVCMVQMVSESGAEKDVLGCGHIAKRDLYDRMHAFLLGFQAAQ